MREAIVAAVRRLSVIPFFPTDENARLEVMRAIESMLGTAQLNGTSPQQRLDWLITTTINEMRTWLGIPDLRGLYCSRWKPADGREGYSTLPGYRAEDSESRAIAESQTFKAIDAGATRPKLLSPAGRERMPDAELDEFFRETVGKLVESTAFPWQKPGSHKSLAQEEQELAEAPRTQLTEAEKSRRLAELQAKLESDRK